MSELPAALLALVGGLAVLLVGGEILVRGATGLAAAARVSPLVIGLTVVAFGTSAPELAVSLRAALADQPGIALGNVVGSNIFNVLLILGVSALIVPLAVSSFLIRRDVPLLVAASLAVYLLGVDGGIGRVEGLGFVVVLIAWTAWIVTASRRERREVVEEFAREFGPGARPGARALLGLLLLVGGGLVALALGSRWLVGGASGIARRLGMSELTIGLTIVAAGTSLPEVVASVMASLKRERDIAVGNVIGSNLFNILGVLGLSAAAAPAGVAVPASSLRVDLPLMIATSAICVPVFLTGRRIDRREGGLFLLGWIAWTAWLLMGR